MARKRVSLSMGRVAYVLRLRERVNRRSIPSPSSAEDAHRGRARARRRARARLRALPRRRQQPRLPRVLRAAGGARDERRHADERAARLHEHALQAALRLPAEGRRGRVGLAAGRTARRRPRRPSVVYKEGRRPMPDLLREQFPHFRPIVEAFGYRNLEFEGWEADDVIATLATRADAAGIRTCVVSTDRDAFQLCSENVCLMMTPRGVADVNVYTPERVEARYGVRPDQVPDFIGLKGDTSDNIPGVPGIGDKTAGQLIAQYGSLEAVIEHAAELSPARAQEHHRARRPGARLEGARDDAPRPRPRLRPGRARARAARPLAAEGDLPPLRVPRPARAASTRSTRRCPAAPIEVTGVEVPWREGELDARRAASATPPPATGPPSPTRDGVVVGAAAGDASRASSSCTTRSRSASTPPTTRCSPRT